MLIFTDSKKISRSRPSSLLKILQWILGNFLHVQARPPSIDLSELQRESRRFQLKKVRVLNLNIFPRLLLWGVALYCYCHSWITMETASNGVDILWKTGLIFENLCLRHILTFPMNLIKMKQFFEIWIKFLLIELAMSTDEMHLKWSKWIE